MKYDITHAIIKKYVTFLPQKYTLCVVTTVRKNFIDSDPKKIVFMYYHQDHLEIFFFQGKGIVIDYLILKKNIYSFFVISIKSDCFKNYF